MICTVCLGESELRKANTAQKSGWNVFTSSTEECVGSRLVFADVTIANMASLLFVFDINVSVLVTFVVRPASSVRVYEGRPRECRLRHASDVNAEHRRRWVKIFLFGNTLSSNSQMFHILFFESYWKSVCACEYFMILVAFEKFNFWGYHVSW